MLDANKKREMMEGIVKDIMQRMKEQGMSQEDILKTIEKISKQEEDWDIKKDFMLLIHVLQKKHFEKPKKMITPLWMILKMNQKSRIC